MISKNIFLIGMMGAGKTTVGKLLAKKLDLTFFDIDLEIEKIMGLSIRDIFEFYSKEKFRLLEMTLFDNMTKKDYFVYGSVFRYIRWWSDNFKRYNQLFKSR